MLAVCQSPEGDAKVALCKNGKALTSYSYDSLVYIADEFFFAWEKGKVGIMSPKAQMIIDPLYEQIFYMPVDKRFITVKNDYYELSDSLGVKLIKSFKILRYYHKSESTPFEIVGEIDFNYEIMYISEEGSTGILDNRGLDLFRPNNNYVWILRNPQTGLIQSYITKWKDQFYVYNSIFLPIKVFNATDVEGVTEDKNLWVKEKDRYVIKNYASDRVDYLREQIMFVEKTNSRFMFINQNGETISGQEYDFIDRITTGTEKGGFKAYLNGETFYFDSEGKGLATE